jgi:hypothetical protein
MAINEEEVERHVRETSEQAKRANYPDHSTPLHAKAPPSPASDHKPTARQPRRPQRRGR